MSNEITNIRPDSLAELQPNSLQLPILVSHQY